MTVYDTPPQYGDWEPTEVDLANAPSGFALRNDDTGEMFPLTNAELTALRVREVSDLANLASRRADRALAMFNDHLLSRTLDGDDAALETLAKVADLDLTAGSEGDIELSNARAAQETDEELLARWDA